MTQPYLPRAGDRKHACDECPQAAAQERDGGHHQGTQNGEALLQQHLPTPDAESARAVLRKWWRQIDRDVYGYQINGALVALLTLAIDSPSPQVLDQVIPDAHRAAVDTTLACHSANF